MNPYCFLLFDKPSPVALFARKHSLSPRAATAFTGTRAGNNQKHNSTLFGLAGGGSTALSLLFSLLSIVLAGIILYLLYRPESSRFYDFRSRVT